MTTTTTNNNNNASRSLSISELAAAVDAILSTSTSSSGSSSQKHEFLEEADEIELVTISDVPIALQLMDKRYKTNFFPWIQDEENADVIAYHCKRVMTNVHVPDLCRGLKWLTANWSVSSVAGFLIKIFYERGMLDVSFITIVESLSSIRTWRETVDLISTLLIGEEPSICAGFLVEMTQRWDSVMTFDLIKGVAEKSRWTNEFYESFILHLVMADDRTTSDEKLQLAQTIVEMFSDRLEASSTMPIEKFQHVYGHHHRMYAERVLERLLIDTRSDCVPSANSLTPKRRTDVASDLISLPSP